MGSSERIRETDVIFLHSDDRATIRYAYSRTDLREGLMLHILYFGRAIVPINFLLANPELDGIFKNHGSLSDESEIYKLIKLGDVIPLMFDDDYLLSTKHTSIRDYAEYSLEHGILLPCPIEQWSQRAELLGNLKFAIPSKRNFRSLYRETFLSLLTHEGIRQGYFASLYHKNKTFFEHLYRETANLERPTRSHTYRLIAEARSKTLQDNLRILADAAYYVAFADATSSNPAIPTAARNALLVHYWRTGSPLIFDEEEQTIEVIGGSLPDFSFLPIPQVLDDLRDTPQRQKWLRTLKNAIAKGKDIDPLAQDLVTAFGEWTQLVVEYFSAAGQKQREALLIKQRKFFKQTRTVQVGSDIMLLLGVGISAYSVTQDFTQGGPSLTSLVSLLLTTGIKLGLYEAKKHLEQHKPIYGSTIPMTKTFTPIGERFG